MDPRGPKLGARTMLGVILRALAFTALIPIGAGVILFIVYAVTGNQALSGFFFALSMVLEVLALAIDRGTYKEQLRRAIVARDEAIQNASGAQAGSAVVTRGEDRSRC